MATMKCFLLGGNENKYGEKQRKLLYFSPLRGNKRILQFPNLKFFSPVGGNMIMIVILILITYLFNRSLNHLFVQN